MSEGRCDLLVIGGGPGGYTAAIQGAQKGLKTVLVERGPLGGTCLNRGCVPTKTLLHDTGLLPVVRNSHFLSGEMKVSLKNIEARRNLVIEGSRNWIRNVLAGRGVTVIPGRASFTGPKTVRVEKEDGGEETLTAAHIVIAAGAGVDYPPELTPDGGSVWNTDQALNVEKPPRTLAVVGGGARGIELARIYHNLGCRVAIFEKERRLLPRLDRGLAGRYRKMLTERGLKVLTRTEVLSARTLADGTARLALAEGAGPGEITVDRVILALPRRPSLEGLNLAAAGLETSGGLLTTGPGFQTSQPGVYVVGDAAGPPYWAHKAIAQGRAAVRHLLGLAADERPRFVPACLYGDPEIGAVGLTEQEVKSLGRSYKLGEFYFVGNGRAGTMGQDQGLVRLFADSGTGEVLGVHILGPGATEMVSTAALAMENGVDLEGFKRTVFAHPSLAETLFEAALAADNEAIHMLLEGVESEPAD
ncbi:MAG: NAD(P)/FAD-dependent oxidoreductase [Thermodesulfobacteriota bacterium]